MSRPVGERGPTADGSPAVLRALAAVSAIARAVCSASVNMVTGDMAAGVPAGTAARIVAARALTAKQCAAQDSSFEAATTAREAAAVASRPGG